MTDPVAPSDPVTHLPPGPDWRLALYDLIARPERLADFLTLREQTVPRPETEAAAHFRLALELMERGRTPVRPAEDSALPQRFEAVAAFLTDGGPRIARANEAARATFALEDGAGIGSLPLESGDLSRLRQIARQVSEGRLSAPFTLRLRHARLGSPLIFRISPSDSPAFPPLALVVASELHWPPHYDAILRAAFGLSQAEAEITRALCQGGSVMAVAELRGRSEATVRTQLRTILTKTETHSQSELVRIALTLLQTAHPAETEAETIAPRSPPGAARPLLAGVARLESHLMRLPGGRRLEWLEFGAPAGRPVLYLPSPWGFLRWPAEAEKAAAARGLRLLVPLRPGFGATSPLPPGMDWDEGVSADHAALLDQLALFDVTILSQGADLRLALLLSERRPDLARRLLAVAPFWPLPEAGDYAALPPGWPRWLRSNARFCPGLLPVITQAGLANKALPGDPGLFEALCGSPPDRQALSRKEVRHALRAGLLQGMLRPEAAGADTLARALIAAERPLADLPDFSRLRLQALCGAEDPFCPAAVSAALLPACARELVPGAGLCCSSAIGTSALSVLICSAVHRSDTLRAFGEQPSGKMSKIRSVYPIGGMSSRDPFDIVKEFRPPFSADFAPRYFRPGVEDLTIPHPFWFLAVGKGKQPSGISLMPLMPHPPPDIA